MQNDYQLTSMCPLFVFDVSARQGQLYNPGNGLIMLEFPRQSSRSDSYPLHEASELSPDFASYLHYLVTEHILFDSLRNNELAYVETNESQYTKSIDGPDDESFSDFGTIWLRAPLSFPGLPSYYDTIGFSFLDESLYTPLYCDVVETKLALDHLARPRNTNPLPNLPQPIARGHPSIISWID